MPTTSYGTWATYAHVLSIRNTVDDYIAGGGDEWVTDVHATGAFDRIVDDFRTAINQNLPGGITLNGDDFYGPYPLADGVRPADLKKTIPAVIEAVDLAAIVERHDPDRDHEGER
jgi:hypothetical protein